MSHFTLNTGYKIPSVGMGCWQGDYGAKNYILEEALLQAIEVGYRHFDTALGFQNEQISGIPRSEFFITCKLESFLMIKSDRIDSLTDRFQTSLNNLGFDIDLYLLHWLQSFVTGVHDADPEPHLVEAWKEIETLLVTGKVESIGVSNFSPKTLDILLKEVTVVPSVNQVELHPFLPDNALLEYCNSKGIHLSAYCPIVGIGKVLTALEQPNADLTIKTIADCVGCTPAQVTLSCGVIRGTSVLPRTVTPSRMKENITLVNLTPEDGEAIDGIHKNDDTKKQGHNGRMSYTPWSGTTAFGWTLDQLGWDVGCAKKF
ncbi:Aldo/keto reductase [Atractiella rhizophila]|nr:Aldo/keto reductase [Atractiella rhizophila]